MDISLNLAELLTLVGDASVASSVWTQTMDASSPPLADDRGAPPPTSPLAINKVHSSAGKKCEQTDAVL